jgi:hypothetical protein
MRIPGNFLLPCAAIAVLAFVFRSPVEPPVQAAQGHAPAYASNGDLLPPSDYREWTYLTSGIDMSYSPQAASSSDSPSVFDNVFVNPEAYRSFMATGTWPDKTIMILEVRQAQSKGSINQRGHFQTGLKDMEAHVKDEARFPGKWAFFSFDAPDKKGTLIPAKAPCYSCHAQHGAVDTTFVQFYPTLLPVAKSKGTLSKAFLSESSDQKAAK